MPHPRVSQWITRNYPKPTVDSDWLRDCCSWVDDEYHLDPVTQFDQYIAHVESQLLQSNLEDSMVPGTGLPANITNMVKEKLSGHPILVELRSITDIGQSAFSLQNTRQTRIDRADLAGLAPEAEEDEGPIPRYPRGMLMFTLSDGSTLINAIEYRSLPQLELGVTPLGFKLLLKDVLIRDKIAFLEPRSVVLKGHQTADHDAVQDELFLRSLRSRLGQPELERVDERPAPPPNPPPPADRVIQPQPQQPRAQPRPAPRVRPRSPTQAPVAGPSGTKHDSDSDLERPHKIAKTQSRPSASPSPTLVQSSYFSNTATSRNNPSAPLARSRILSPARASPGFMDSDDDFEAFVSETKSKEKGKAVKDADSEPDWDAMSINEDFLAQADRIEMEALGSQNHPEKPAPSQFASSHHDSGFASMSSQPSSGSGNYSAPSSAPSQQSIVQNQRLGKWVAEEIIEIEDDDDDDEKENIRVPKKTIIDEDIIYISD